jgi:hypothetical protein
MTVKLADNRGAEEDDTIAFDNEDDKNEWEDEQKVK